MQPQPSTPRREFNFANYYKECADFPETPKFRRFAAQWNKKLHEDVADLVKEEGKLSKAIADARERDKAPPLTFLECPRRLVPEELKKGCSDYENKLRIYAQDLCLYSSLFRFPDHEPYFSKRLNNYSELFEGGDFGPTDEPGAASEYQDINARDFLTVVGENRSDALTIFLVAHIDWIDQQILQRIRAFLGRPRPTPAVPGVEHGTIVKIADAIACVFVPFLLTSTMFALARTRPLMVRICVVSIFGLVFAISAKLISSNMSRGEIFSFSAAFFAVASVFVSSTNGSVSSPS